MRDRARRRPRTRSPRCRWAGRRRGAGRRCSRSHGRSGTPPTATRGRGTCRAGARPAGAPAARRRRSRCSTSPIRAVPVARASCSKRGPPINAPSSCSSSTRFASGSSAPFSHGGTAERHVDLDLDRHARARRRLGAPRSACSTVLSTARPSSRIFQCRNGSTSSNDSGPAPRTRGRPSGPARVVDLARGEQVEHPSVTGADVHLDVVGVPLVGDRLDPDPRQARPRCRDPRSTRSPTRASPDSRAASAKTNSRSSPSPPLRSIVIPIPLGCESGVGRAAGHVAERRRRGRACAPVACRAPAR